MQIQIPLPSGFSYTPRINLPMAVPADKYIVQSDNTATKGRRVGCERAARRNQME
jgi:hypothetical protein